MVKLPLLLNRQGKHDHSAFTPSTCLSAQRCGAAWNFPCIGRATTLPSPLQTPGRVGGRCRYVSYSQTPTARQTPEAHTESTMCSQACLCISVCQQRCLCVSPICFQYGPYPCLSQQQHGQSLRLRKRSHRHSQNLVSLLQGEDWAGFAGACLGCVLLRARVSGLGGRCKGVR